MASCATTADQIKPTPAAISQPNFAGSCSWGRDVGPADRYHLQMHPLGGPGQRVAVWARPDHRQDREHLLGELLGGTLVNAEGPVKGDELVYAVALRDHRLQGCRGYVQASRLVEPRGRPPGRNSLF